MTHKIFGSLRTHNDQISKLECKKLMHKNDDSKCYFLIFLSEFVIIYAMYESK